MRRLRPLIVLLLLAAAAYGGYYVYSRPPSSLVLTGIVTTNDVIVSPQITGQLTDIRVREGDAVSREQVLAVITSGELQAEHAYYTPSAEGLASQVSGSAAALRYQDQQAAEQIRQAEANVAATEAQQAAAVADLEQARLAYERRQVMSQQGLTPAEEFDRA